MDTNPVNLDKIEQISEKSNEVFEVFEISLSSPESPETTTELRQASTVKPEPELLTSMLLSDMYRRGRFLFSSSGSDES